MYTCFLFLFFLRVCSKQSYCFAFNATPEGGTRYIVYQSKGFSRLVICFDVHKNHIESPYSRSVFNFLPGLDSLLVSVQSHVWLLYIFLVYSQSRSNWNVGFWIFNGVYNWRAFRGRKTSPNVLYCHSVEDLCKFS